jgi:hypothetical protein
VWLHDPDDHSGDLHRCSDNLQLTAKSKLESQKTFGRKLRSFVAMNLTFRRAQKQFVAFFDKP